MDTIGANQDRTDESYRPRDGFHALLIELYETDRTQIRFERAEQMLVISPATDDPKLRDRILEHWSALSAFLPGNCDHCHEYAFERTELYWPPHAHLCRPCTALVVRYFDQHGWPDLSAEIEEAP